MTAALYGGRADCKVLVLEPALPGGEIASSAWLDNYPGFHEGIGGMEFGQLLAQHADRFGSETIAARVEKADLTGSPKKVVASGKEYLARTVIMATGTLPRSLGAAGEEEFKGRGISYCATCDAPFFKNKDTMVVGGGDSALEEAFYLSRFARSVTIVHRRQQFRAVKKLWERGKKDPKINFLLDTVVKEFKGNQALEKVLLENVKTNQQQLVEVNGAFIYVGRLPNTGFVDELEKDGQGYLITNETMETSLPGVFAAGDVRRKFLRQVVTAAADGAIAATMAIKYLDEVL